MSKDIEFKFNVDDKYASATRKTDGKEVRIKFDGNYETTKKKLLSKLKLTLILLLFSVTLSAQHFNTKVMTDHWGTTEKMGNYNFELHSDKIYVWDDGLSYYEDIINTLYKNNYTVYYVSTGYYIFHENEYGRCIQVAYNPQIGARIFYQN